MQRLDHLLSRLGYCTRSEARDWIKAGRVAIGGEEAFDAAEKAHPEDVSVDGEPLDHPQGILIVYNKPLGEVCSRDSREGPSVFEALPELWQRRNPAVSTVGRLDKDSTGILLVTDQGPLAHKLASPKHKVPKVYRVEVDKDLDQDLVSLFATGTLVLEGEEDPCAPSELRILSSRIAEITLVEGRFRQVRRMLASQGYMTLSLQRIRYGALELGDLKEGEWKELPLDYFDRLG